MSLIDFKLLLVSVFYTTVFGNQALPHPPVNLSNDREETIWRSAQGTRDKTPQPIRFQSQTVTNTRLPETGSSTLRTKHTKRADAIDNTGLRLRMSKGSVSDVNGFTLNSIPIPLPDLVNLLLATYSDLSLYQSQTSDMDFYQFNGTAWCLKVVVSTHMLRFSTISSIVKTFLRSMVGRYPSKLSWTPVGCLYQDHSPITDIAMFPWTTNEAFISMDFGRGNAPSIPTTPAHIMTLSPAGAINTTEIISPNALDIYTTSSATNLPKRLPIAGEIIVKVFNTALYVVRRIDFDAELGDRVVRALSLYIEAAVGLSINSMAFGILAESTKIQWFDDIFDRVPLIDGGSYRVGKMLVRFQARATARDVQGKPLGFAAQTWDTLATTLSTVLRNVPQVVPVYAVGGEINGLDTVNQTGKVVQIGQWQITVSPTPVNVHDEPGESTVIP